MPNDFNTLILALNRTCATKGYHWRFQDSRLKAVISTSCDDLLAPWPQAIEIAQFHWHTGEITWGNGQLADFVREVFELWRKNR